ncbi:hypothetical protein GMRT_10006 [Giardia muris]|uniref:Uncharacterized protein n=1 Tax=Giardia muris TaxID=5742 RepID=A0A4Z1SSV5_GIAMU|nr:hypothetical protein GMRT_10006 [Giardia muris]|eukprot:TNJ28075.1 hypothetical protein GMRT_10006 [Giardia muris]
MDPRQWYKLRIAQTLHDAIQKPLPPCLIRSVANLLTYAKEKRTDRDYLARLCRIYLNLSDKDADGVAQDAVCAINKLDEMLANGGVVDTEDEKLFCLEKQLMQAYVRPKVPQLPSRTSLKVLPPIDSRVHLTRTLHPAILLSNIPIENNTITKVAKTLEAFGDLVQVTTNPSRGTATAQFSMLISAIFCARAFQTKSFLIDSQYHGVSACLLVEAMEQGAIPPSPLASQTGSIECEQLASKPVRALEPAVKQVPSATGQMSVAELLVLKGKQAVEQEQKRTHLLISNVPDKYRGTQFLTTGCILNVKAVQSAAEGLGHDGEYCMLIHMHTDKAAYALLKTIEKNREKLGGITVKFFEGSLTNPKPVVFSNPAEERTQ